MGILDNVERGLERAVNGAFARTFRSGVQPVEIASALKRELDIGAVIVDRDRVLAPNRFVVRVSEKDAARLLNLGDTLERELRGVVTKHAARQSYQLLGEPDVEIRSDSSLTTGVVEINASRVEGAVDWVAAIDVDGVRHELRRGTTTVGRGSDCGIQITDTAASRKHLEIIWDGAAGIARDLGSTNGSKIDGQRFSEAALSPGIVITIGQSQLRFDLVPGHANARVSAQQGAAASNPATTAWPTQRGQGAGQDQAKAQTPKPHQHQSAPPRSESLAPMPSAAAEPAAPKTPPLDRSTDADAPGIDQDFWRGL